MTDLPDDVPTDAAETLDSKGDGPTPDGGAGAHSRRPGRRAGLIGAAALAVALVGGGVAYGVAQLSGGGAQPDTMVPASALAIVSVDLDPSAGQKIDALRFARAFPELKSRMGGGEDLRKILFDAMSGSAQVAGSWRDVEPWLGDRAALAVLPAADELDDPVPVVVLAVTDEGKARAGLRKAVPEASCEVADSFAVCAHDVATVERAMSDAAKKSLADDSAYARDLDALGDQGILAAWADLDRVSAAAPDLLAGLRGVGSSLASAEDQLQGRYVAAVRFDGPRLEVAGRVEGAGLPRMGGSTDAGTLPKDTLVALGFGDADKVVGSAWQRVREAASAMGGEQTFDDQVSMLSSTYGITLPDDLTAAVGDRLTVAVGAGSTPRVALRVTGSTDSVARLRGAVQRASGSALQVATATSGGATVLATDQAYATAVAQGQGLGGTDAFRDAVPDADRAQGVLYLDIAGLVAAYGPQLGIDASTLQQIRPLSALGVSVHQDGDALDYRLRLVTR